MPFSLACIDDPEAQRQVRPLWSGQGGLKSLQKVILKLRRGSPGPGAQGVLNPGSAALWFCDLGQVLLAV